MGKVLKVILIVLAVIVGVVVLLAVLLVGLIIKNHFDSLKPYLSDDYYNEFKSNSPLEKKYAGLGSCEVANIDFDAGDKKIGQYRIL